MQRHGQWTERNEDNVDKVGELAAKSRDKSRNQRTVREIARQTDDHLSPAVRKDLPAVMI